MEDIVCGVKLEERAAQIAKEVGGQFSKIRIQLLIAHAELGRKVRPAHRRGSDAVITRFTNGRMDAYEPFVRIDSFPSTVQLQ